MSSNNGSKPWWRPVVDGIDKTITPPANALVRSNVFADAVSTGSRLEARLRRRIEAQTTWWLHQWNLPSATDVRRVRAQLAAVEARLRDLDERLEDHFHIEASKLREGASDSSD